MTNKLLLLYALLILLSCKKESNDPHLGVILIDSLYVNNSFILNNGSVSNIDYHQVDIRVKFHEQVDTMHFNKNKLFITGGVDTNYIHWFTDRQNLVIRIPYPLESLSTYSVIFDQGPNLGGTVFENYSFVFHTSLDYTPKFPQISEDSLLTLVQKRTFDYFWEYGHPVSGLSRDRLGGGDVVTSGGSGFGIMSIITGVERGFITRDAGFQRIEKMVHFLIGPATTKFHGAFPHWLNGSSGSTIPFSSKDNGGDLVETAFLMQGLLTAKEYFNNSNTSETALRDSIQKLWENVEWEWYRNGDQNVLYWHWSPDFAFQMNMAVQGWNEALIVYIMAASSPTHTIPKDVYLQGWTRNGGMINGNTYYDLELPLGESYGGPLFFAHYSFLGLDPRNLSDAYASYWTQNTTHSRINYEYCVDNPRNYPAYGPDCWGLTASDIPGGYSASSPTNDLGVIAPTAALSSIPYTPEESINAMKFFYYILGDKIWGEYGFYDSFSLKDKWFASSYLAIDQGPIVCMIENYRTGLLWNLFMSNTDIQAGLNKLGFSY